MRTIDSSEQIGATRGHVAINMALVLVQEHPPLGFRTIDHPRKKRQYFVATILRLFALVVKGENTDKGGGKFPCPSQRDLEACKVFLQVRADLHLADRRANRRNRDSRRRQPLFKRFHLFRPHIQHARTTDSAQFQIGESGLLQCTDLHIGIRLDLVGKTRDLNHFPSSFCGGHGSKQAPVGRGPRGRHLKSSYERYATSNHGVSRRV